MSVMNVTSIFVIKGGEYMKRVLTHYVQMETYEVPDQIIKKGDDAIEDYIFRERLVPVKTDCRDWEVLEVLDD